MFREIIQVKVTVLGNANVGKSSIINRFIKEEYYENSEPTIGANFLSKVVEFEKFAVKLNIWDTAGQERYSSLAASYTRGSQACLLVYDITSVESFEGVDRWFNNIRSHLDSDCHIFVVGNKEDLIDNEGIKLEQAQEYCKKIECEHFRVSAKSGAGLNEMFLELCKKIMGNQNLTQASGNRSDRGFSVSITDTKIIKPKKCCKG